MAKELIKISTVKRILTGCSESKHEGYYLNVETAAKMLSEFFRKNHVYKYECKKQRCEDKEETRCADCNWYGYKKNCENNTSVNYIHPHEYYTETEIINTFLDKEQTDLSPYSMTVYVTKIKYDQPLTDSRK